MDARTWLGLQPTHNPNRWVLPVVEGLTTHGGFLFGGCGLGAAIEALEGTTGRPIVWATAQYLSYAMAGSTLDIDVTVAVSGHQITQARATGHVADREIFTVNAALGTRDYEGEGQWETMPAVDPPDVLPVRTSSLGDGTAALWIRLPELLDMSAPALAILGDYVPFGIGQALGRLGGGNSLDNTLRVAKVVPTDWVLLDVRVHAVRSGFGHGLVHLWATDGTLLATASQSTIVRHWTEERTAVARQHQRDRSSSGEKP